MTEYQKNKIAELGGMGWVKCGWHIAGYIFVMESASGIRAYIYPDWVHHIAPE